MKKVSDMYCHRLYYSYLFLLLPWLKLIPNWFVLSHLCLYHSFLPLSLASLSPLLLSLFFFFDNYYKRNVHLTESIYSMSNSLSSSPFFHLHCQCIYLQLSTQQLYVSADTLPLPPQRVCVLFFFFLFFFWEGPELTQSFFFSFLNKSK